MFSDLIPEDNQPAQPKANGLFDDLVPSQPQAPQAASANLFSDLIPESPKPATTPFDNRYSALMAEEEQHQAAMADYELAMADYQAEQALPAIASHTMAEPALPELPVRDLATLQSDYALGLNYLRENEFSQLVNDLEQGFYPGYEGRALVEQLSAPLSPEAQRLLQLAQMTGEELNKQRHVSNRLTTNQDRKQDVFRRGFYDGVTLGYANAPDEDKLNSDDLSVAAAERALQLIRNEEAANQPLQNLLGQGAGMLLPFGAGISGLRALRAARGLAPVGKGATGAMVEGATVGAPLGFAYRPEGAEDMTVGENLTARFQNAALEVGLGALFDGGVVKAGQWLQAVPKLVQDKNFERLVKKAGYENVKDFLGKLGKIETFEDGRQFFVLNKEIADDLPDPDFNPLAQESGAVPPASARTPEGSQQQSDFLNNLPETESVDSGISTPELDPAIKAASNPSGGFVPYSKVTTIRGTSVDVDYALVEADDLITSNNANGIANPDYPAHLQPRDRSKGSSEAQIRTMSANLRPEWMGASPKASDGAPIIGPDRVVESGNGRVAALRYDYEAGDPAGYKQWLDENAEVYGLDREQIGAMNKPVMVRVRKTPLDDANRAFFAREANQSDIARMSPTEQAKADGDLLTDDDILHYAPDEDGNINTPKNMDFIRRFVSRLGTLDGGSLVDANGRPNADAVKRIQAAVFTKAYDDDRLLSLFAEEARPELSNLLKSLNQAAPSFARARSFDGTLGGESNIVPNLMDAVDIVRTSRRDGQAVSEILSQQSLLGEMDEITAQLARYMDGNLDSPKRMGETFKEIAVQLETEVSKGGNDMFSSAPASRQDFIDSTDNTLRGRYGEEARTIQGAADKGAGRTAEKSTGQTQEPTVSGHDAQSGGQGEQSGRGRTAARVAESEPEPRGRGDVFVKAGDSKDDALQVMGRTVRHVKTGTLPTGIKSVASPDDLAHVVAPYRKDAQESFITVVTDDQGNVLRVARMFTGGKGEASVYPGTVAGVVANTPNAKKAWFVHNHPSGGVIQSDADKELTSRLHDLLDGTGVEAQGSVVIGPSGKYSYHHPTNKWGELNNDMAADQLDVEGGLEQPIPAKARRDSVPVTERRLTGRDSQQATVTDSTDLEEYFQTNSQQREGVLLLDSQRKPVGFLPMSREDMRFLRTGEGGGSQKLLQAVDQSNASYIAGKVDTESMPEVQAVAGNLNGFARQADLDMVDVIDGQGRAFGERYDIPQQSTFYANPLPVAVRTIAREWTKDNTVGALGGSVYGGISSDDEVGSAQWWLDVAAGATAGGLVSYTARATNLVGKGSYADKAKGWLGNAIEHLPFIGRGGKEIREVKARQQLMRQMVDRQTEKAGDFLLKNFTPSERAQMADLIEQRGIIRDFNLIHRQAQELDDFVTHAAENMKRMGMLDPEMETGGYLHRYYAKHLKLDKQFIKAKGQSMSGSYTMARGTDDSFSMEYLSDLARADLKKHEELTHRLDKLEGKKDGLFESDTAAEMAEIRAELREISQRNFREYTGMQNGKLRSFILADDELPSVKGVTMEPTERNWTMKGVVKGKALMHRDWTKAERQAWGEIEDAGYRFVRGMAEVSHDLSLATMFKTIGDNPEWVSDTARDGWVKVTNQGVGKKSPMKKYGALADQYVRPDIWNAVRHHGRSPLGTGKVATVYRGILNRWKLYKTVYNPVTHFNNTWSNTEMYSMAGYSPKYLGRSAKLVFGRNSEADPLFREALDAGLFGNDWSASIVKSEGGASTVLEDLAERMRNQPEVEEGTVIDTLDTVMRLKEWWIGSKNAVREADTKLGTGLAVAKAIAEPPSRLVSKPIKAATQAAQSLYRKEDELFKMAVYMSEREAGKSAREAVNAANHFFFDYNDLPTAVKWVRDFPIGSPFISYTYLAIPAIVKNAVEKPERLIALAAAYEAVNYSGLMVNEDLAPGEYWNRRDAENKVSPKWERGRALWGGLNTFHVPFLEGERLSLANAHALGNPFAGEAGNRKLALPESLAPFASFWGSDALGSNPLRSLIDVFILNEDWKGKQIYGKNASAQEKISKGMNYLYQAWAPSNPVTPGSYHQQKMIEGVANSVAEDKQAGKEPNFMAEGVVNAANSFSELMGGQQFTGVDGMKNPIVLRNAALASVGFKLRPFRPEDGFQFKAREIQDKLQEYQKELSSKAWLKGKKRITKAQFEEYRVYYRNKMKEAQQEMKELRAAKKEVVR